MPNKVPVKFFRTSPLAATPKYQSDDAAGFDLITTKDLVIPPGAIVLAETGLKVAVPSGYEIQVRPRSGLSLKTKLRVANSPGTIDADYRGEVGVILENISNSSNSPAEYERNTLRFKAGDRVAQGVLAEVPQANFQEVSSVEDLGATQRGEGGFGSTGSKS